MSDDCWSAAFSIQALHARNVASGELVWPD